MIKKIVYAADSNSVRIMGIKSAVYRIEFMIFEKVFAYLN
jgi:hypothetical protein